MARPADVLLPLAGAIAGLSPYLGSAIRSGATVSLAMQRGRERRAEEEAAAAEEAAAKEQAQEQARRLIEALSGMDDPRANLLRSIIPTTSEPLSYADEIYRLLEPPKPGEPPEPWMDELLANIGAAGEGVPPGTSRTVSGKAGGVNISQTYKNQPPEVPGSEWTDWSLVNAAGGMVKRRIHTKTGKVELEWLKVPTDLGDDGSTAIQIRRKELAIQSAEARIKRLEDSLKDLQATQAGTMWAGRQSPESNKILADIEAEKLKLANLRLDMLELTGEEPQPNPVPAPAPGAPGLAVSHAPSPVPAAPTARRFDKFGNEVR